MVGWVRESGLESVEEFISFWRHFMAIVIPREHYSKEEGNPEFLRFCLRKRLYR